MSLEGAKFICLDEAGNQGEIVLAKGRKFTVGYYVSCDFVLADERAKGVHCEIECDAFGRVTIRNLSPDKPILVNGSAVEIKRILLNNSKLSILDKEYLWLFPMSSSNEFEDLPIEAASTPQKHVGMPEQPPNSCPDFKLHREVPKRFTVHNFAYCIQSDEEGNTSTDSNDDNANEDMTQTNKSPKDDDSQTQKDLESNELINQEQEDNNVIETKDKHNRSVTPEPKVEEDNTTKTLMETPKMNLINYTKDKTNKSTEKKKKQLLTACHQSDIVITSFSPRETGVKIEKSFATIMKPKVLVTKTPATPRSAYSTPKGEIPNNDVGMEDDKELMTFHTPSTSKKGTSTASTKVLKNSSMHLIDLTTPHKLRPASPFLKSALKASAKKNVTQNAGDKTQSGKLASEEQLGLSALPSTPALSEASNSPLETPNSVISVSSSTDSSSIIEVTSDGSNMGITPGSATGLTTPIKATNLAGACTPKRTPQSLMKRALLTSAKKQNTTPQRNANTTAAGTTTPRRESINRIPLRSNLALLRSPSTPQASTGDKSSSQLARRHSMSTPTRKSISAISRFDSPTTSTLAPASPSSSTRFATSRRTSLNPISAARALPTSTPVAGSSNNPALRTRAACKTSPLHKVRKSVGGMPLTSHISKARRSIVLPASTSKITSIKEKSPQQVMSGRLVSRARKSLCVTPISARSRSMVTAAKTPPHPPSSILKDKTTQSARKPEKKAVLFADKKPADIGDVDDLSRTFIIDSDDEENTNNGNPADKPKDATFSPEKETKETVSEKEAKKEQPAIEIPVDVEEITDLTEDNSQTEVEKSKENNEKLENNDKKEDNSRSEIENNEKFENNDKKESIVTEESFADIINDSKESQEVNKLTETIEIPDSPKESSQTESQENFADVVEEIIQDNTVNETNSKEITKDATTTLAEDNSEKGIVIETGFGEESVVEIIETSNKETKADETKEAQEISNKNNEDNETDKQNTEENKIATIETPSSTQDEVITSETVIAETKSIDVQEDDKITNAGEEGKSKTEYKPIVEDITLEGSLIEKEANVSKQPLYEDITLEGSLIEEDKVKNEDIKQETTEGVTSTADNPKLLETTEEITKECEISEIPKTSEVSQEKDIEIASNTQKPQSSSIEEKSTIDELELKETKSANVAVLEESLTESIDNPEILEKSETSVIGDDLENTNKLLEEIEDVLNKSDEIKQKHLIELEEANQESDNPLTEEFESEKLTQESKEKIEETISSVSDDKNQQEISTESNALSEETDTKNQVEQKILDNIQTSEKEEQVDQNNSRKEDAESQEEDIPTDIEVTKQEENVDQAILKTQDENIPAEKSFKDVEDNNVSDDTVPQRKENTFEEECSDSATQIKSDVNEHQICKTDIVQNEEVSDVIVSSTEEVIINEETQNKTEALEIVEECEKNKENLETSEEVTVSEESSNTEQKTEPSEIDIESEKDVEKVETSIQSSDNVISEIEDSNKNKESSEILSQETEPENEPEIIQEKSTKMVTEIVQDNEKTEQEIETKLAQEKKSEENVVSETEDSSKEKQIEEKSEETISEISVHKKDETIEPQTALGVQNENQSEELVQKENVSQVADKTSDIKPEEQTDKSKKKTENSASFTPRRSTRRASQSAETSQASTELSFTPRRSARRASMSAESTTTYTPTKRTTRRASLSVVNETPLTPKAITKRRPSISLDNDEISKPSTSKTPRAKTPRKQIEQRMVIPEEMEEVVGAAIIEEVEEPAEEVVEIGKKKRRSSFANNASTSTIETPHRKLKESMVIPEENAEIIENVEKQQNQEIESLAKAESVKLKEEDKKDLEKVTTDRLATEETVESLVLETSTKISEENVKSIQNVIPSEDSKQDDAEGSTHQTKDNKTEPVVVSDNIVSSKKEEETINASDIPVKADEKMQNDLKEVDVVDKVNLKDNIVAEEETSKEHIAIEKSMEAKEIQEDLAESADDKEEQQQKTPTKDITVETENSHINTPVAKKAVTIIAESPKTPLMSGVRELLKTPKTEVQTPRLEGIKDLVRSPKETHENEEEEVEKLAVIANLTKTPKTTSTERVLEQETLTPKTKKQIKIIADSPKTPLMSGMRELLKTPKAEVQTPRLGGIRDMVRSPKDTNENEEEETEKLAVVADLIKTPKVTPEDKEISTPEAKKHVTIEAISPQTPLMAGMRELLKTPKCEINTPKLEGIRDLVKTPKSKTENEQEETEKLAVVAELVNTPQVEVEQMPSSSHKNDNLQGVKELLQTPKSCNTPRFKGMRELMQTPKLSSTPLMAGVKELLDSPAVQENSEDVSQENTDELPCSTATKTGPNLKGVKDLMKTPKSCSTPRLKGIRELMQTPKMSSTPLMGGLKELMDSAAQNKEEELDKYLRTPTAKNIMIPTMPSSAVIEKSSDSIEISTEYDLNATNEAETAHLEDLFKTPVASRFAERITASYYGEEDEEHDETLEKFSKNKNETLQDTINKSAEEAFDKLVGQETQIQTPIRKVYPRKSFALQTPQAQSPFTAADVLSDLPKTDVEEWIETLDQAEPPSIIECDDEVGDSTQQKVEDEDVAIESLKVEEDDEESSVLEESLADKDKQDTISNDSVIPETCTKVYLPEKTLTNTTTASLTNTDAKDPLRDTNQKHKKEKETRPVTPIDAEISGINLLDQTVDSVQDEPSILEEPLVVEEPSIFEEPLMVSDNESEADNTINKGDETEVLEVSQDDANDLSEPLMVSDSEDLNQSQEKEIDNEVESKEKGNEESNLDVEKSMVDKDSNISLSEDPLQTKDKEPESSVILVDDEKSLIEINESIKQQESLIETHSVGDESSIIKDSSTKESEVKENKNDDAEILSTSQEPDILGEESLQLEDSPTKETINDKQKEDDISLTVQTKEANEDLEAEVDAAETVVITEDIPSAKIENQEAKEIYIKETKVLSNESDDIFVDTSVTEIFEETTATNDEHTAESHEITEPMKQNIESDIKKSSPENIEKDAIKKSSPQLDHECQDIFMDSSNIDESFAAEETNVESESAKPETSTEISKQENNSVAVVDDIKENQTAEEHSDDIVKEADPSEKTSEIHDVEEKQQIIKEIDASQTKSDSESVITEEREICEESSLISEEVEQIPAEEIETEPEQINQVKCLSTDQTISTTPLEKITTSDKTVESEIDNKSAETTDEQKIQDIEISTEESKELQKQSDVVSSEEDKEIDVPIEEDKNQENIAAEPPKKSSNELNEQPCETILNESSVSNEEISQSKSEISRIEKDDTISNKKDEVKQTDVVPSSTEEENVSTTEQKNVVSLSTEESKSLLPEHEETTSSDLEAKEGTSESVEVVPSTLTECEESDNSARNDSEETASIALKMEETTTEEEIVYDTEVVSSTEEQSIETEKELPKEIVQSDLVIVEDKITDAGEVVSELKGEIVSLTEEESKERAIVSRNEFEESASIALEEKEENSASDKNDVEIVSSTAEESKEIEQISLKESETSASVILKVEETATVEAITQPSEVIDSKEVESKEVAQVTLNETEESASIILKVEETVSEEVSTNESEVSDAIPLEMETTSAEKFTLNPEEEEVPSTVEESKLAEQGSVIESEVSGAVVSEVEETASEAKLAEKESVIESEVSGAVVLEVDETISEAKLTEKESVIESEVSDAVVLQVEEGASEPKLEEKESVIDSEASGAVVSKVEETASDEVSSTVDGIEKVPTNDSNELSVISEAKENATEETTIKEKISDENETTEYSTQIDEVIVSKSEETPSTASKVEDHSTEEKVDSEISEEKDVAKHGEEVSSTAEESKQREKLTTSESVESSCVLLTDEAESNNKNENLKPDEIVTSTAVENKDNESIISKESVAPTEIVKSYDFEIKIKDAESQPKESEDINKKEATSQRKRKGPQSTEASSANVEIPLRDEKLEEAEVESPEYEKIEKVEKTIITTEEVPRSSRRKRTVSESSQDSAQGDEHGSSSRRDRRKVVKKTTCEKLEDVKEEEIIQLDKVKDEKPKRKRTASESSQGSVKDDDISTTTRRTRRRVQRAPVEETVVEQKEEIEELIPKDTQVPSPSKQKENNENLMIERTKEVTAESTVDDVNMEQNENIPTDVTSTEDVKREVAELVDNKQDVTQVTVEVQELANENQDENKPEEVTFEQATPAEDVSEDNNVQNLEDETKEAVPNEDLGEPLKPTVTDKDLIEVQSTKIEENDTQSSQISEVKEENETQYTETPALKAEISEAKEEETKSKLSDIIEMPEPLNTESVTDDLQEVESIAVDEPKELPVKRGRRKPTISESSQGSVHDEEPATHIRKPRRKVQKASVEEVVLEEPPTDREHNTVDVASVDENVLPTTEGNIDLETKPLKDSENISTTVSEEVEPEIVTLEEVKEQTMRRGRRKPTVSESSQGSVHDDDSSRTRKGRRKVQKAPIEEIVLEENEPQVEIKEPEETKEKAEVKEESKQILIATEEQKEEDVKEIIVETEEHKDVTEKTELKEVEAAVVEEVIEEHEDVSEKTELNVVEATVVEEVIEISNEQVSVSNKEDLTPESHSEIPALESIQIVQEENIESKVENEKQQEMPENVVEDRIEDEESKEAVVKRTRRKRDLKDTALEEPTTSRKARRKNQTAMTTTEESIPESVATEEVPETKLSTIEDLKVNDEPVVETADEQPLDEVSATSNKEEHHEDEVTTKHVGKRGRRKFELEEISNETTANTKETIHATRRGGRHKTIVSETAATEIPKVRNITRTRKTPLEQSSEISNDEELALINENIPEIPTAEDAISPDIPKARNTSRNRKTPIDHPKTSVQNEDQKESIEETPTALEVPETIAEIENPKTDNVVIIEDSPDENKPSNAKLANSPGEEHSADSESKDDDKSNTKRGKRNRTASETNKDLVIDVKPPKRRAKQQAEEVHEENLNKADEPQVTEVSNEKEVAEKPLKISRRRGAATHHEEEYHEELPTKSRRRRARHEDSEEHHTIENEPMKLVEEPSVSEVRITEVNLEPEEVVEKTTSPQEENQATGRRARRNVANEEHHLDAAAKHIEQDNEENTTTSRRRVGRRKHVGEGHEAEEEPVTHTETTHKRRNVGRRKQEEDHHDDVTFEEGKQHEAPDVANSQQNIDKDKQDHDDNEASTAKHVAEEEIKHVESIETTSKRRHIGRKKHEELEDQHKPPKHDSAADEQQHIEITDMATKRHVGRKKHDTETHHEKDNVANIISVDIENQTEHSPEETKKVRGRRKKIDHPEEEVTTSLSPKAKHRGRKRKESHNDTHDVPIEKEEPHVPEEKSTKEPEMKLDIVSAHSETPQRAAPRGRKASAIEHITAESHEAEDTPGRRARNVPQRRAATAYHNYDETSDSEVKTKTTKKKIDSPRKSLEVTKTSPTATITSAPVINASPSPSSTASATTARGRTRKPTAKVQQFLEEERAKAETPKKRGLLAAAAIVDGATTPQRTPARRGRKASTIETEIEGTPVAAKGRGRGKHTVTTATHAKEEHADEPKHEAEATAIVVEEKEVELHTTPPQAQPAAKGRRGRKAKINEEEHQKSDEPPAKKSPLELEIEKQNSSPSVDAPTPPTRVAGRRNAAAAAKARIEEDALAAAAIDPPKKARARKAPTKVSTPIISATPDTEVHSSEVEEEKVTKTKSSPSKREHRLASASTLEGAEDLEDHHIENESTDKPVNKRGRKAIAHTNTDSPAVPVKRSRKAKTAEEATETNTEEDAKPTRGRGRGRKNVHFDEHGEEPETTATTSSHQNTPDIETPVVVESSEPVKRGTRTRRK